MYSLRSLSFSFCLLSSSARSASLCCSGCSCVSASLLPPSAFLRFSLSCESSRAFSCCSSSSSLSRICDWSLSVWSIFLSLSSSSRSCEQCESAWRSWRRSWSISSSIVLDEVRPWRYSALPRISRTSNVCASPMSFLWNVSFTKLPWGPRMSPRSTLSGSPTTLCSSTLRIWSPTRTEPSLSEEPPDTIVLTTTLPSPSCWKKIPTPACTGPPPSPLNTFELFIVPSLRLSTTISQPN
mmetsp:Transcript_48850/g.122065  ORF Transcript_48850/g.122065 Transcript_48850/m.122065 type:complete len:239 (-) Transcript_48850:44-760(-)